ncbi:MAG: hypothetical protein R3E66_19425 [bacterium]
MRRLTGLIAALIVCTSSTAMAANAIDMRLGIRGAGNYSILMAPDDAAGDPTLLSGAGFKGFGGGGGIASMYYLTSLAGGQLYLALDLLFVAHSGTGKAEAPATDQRRTVTLTSKILHAPLHIGLLTQSGTTGFRFSLGPELLLGLGSGASVEQQNISEPPQPLFTTPVTHVGLSANVGMDFGFDGWIVPIDFRFVVDPSVPASTSDRFDNYESNADPGNYQVGYNYQIFLTVGVDRLFRLRK